MTNYVVEDTRVARSVLRFKDLEPGDLFVRPEDVSDSREPGIFMVVDSERAHEKRFGTRVGPKNLRCYIGAGENGRFPDDTEVIRLNKVRIVIEG